MLKQRKATIKKKQLMLGIENQGAPVGGPRATSENGDDFAMSRGNRVAIGSIETEDILSGRESNRRQSNLPGIVGGGATRKPKILHDQVMTIIK